MFSQVNDIKHIEHDFLSVSWVMIKQWDFGVLGCQNFNFSEHGHVAYKLKGMKSSTGYK